MSDYDDIKPDPDDPMSVYRDRPAGQQVKVYMAGHTSIGQELELSWTLTLPDNVEAREDGAHRLAHQTWHMIAGLPEPEVETYDIEGDVDHELVQATKDALSAELDRQERWKTAFADFMDRVHKARPKGEAKWN